MPTVEFTCEVCGKEKTRWVHDGDKPRFCSLACRGVGLHGSLKPEKRIVTPQMHDKIKSLYENIPGRGEIAAFAKACGLPRWKISKYAIGQGWTKKRFKEPCWTEQEVRILEQSAHMSLGSIQKRLKEAGFHRSQCGIQIKRKRERCLQNLKGQSLRSVAECFGIDAKSALLWVKKGWLQAKRRGTARTEAQGGDVWLIKDKDIKKFIIAYVEVVDFRKIDKFWLVDLLAGGYFGTGPARVPDDNSIMEEIAND